MITDGLDFSSRNLELDADSLINEKNILVYIIFMMASAHGAGLMLVPIILGWSQGNYVESAAHSEHLSNIGDTGHTSPPQMAAFSGALGWLAAVGVHSAGYLLVAALIALLVYEKLGLTLLSRAWFNLDLLWTIALMISGVVILVV
ncbi:MAG: hypothetical protein ACR2G5_14210 [Pyrinomonadaceae bacterium]